MALKIKITPTKPPKDTDKEYIKEETKKYIKIIQERQHILYAQSKYSLLIVLQGMDASGKDGATKAIFTSVNPQGVSVTSFKKPTEIEAKHDFLWRVHKEVPEKGMIKIFNRSHYEDVLITKVNGWIDNKEAKKRYEHINNFERLLEDNGTKILKFYLHISQEEQAKRFEERLTNPLKNWKYNPEDLKTSQKWDDYMEAYSYAFEYCSEPRWHIIPADKNWYKEYLIAKEVAEALQKLDLKFPKLNEK